jgi:hypothetical protein
MRSIAICVLVVGLATCTDSDPGRSRLDAERDACAARAMASPEAQVLQHRLQGSGTGDKATPTEAAQMTTLHHDYLRPCQEIELEIAGRLHPSLPTLYNAAAAKADANIAKLVSYQISWDEYARNGIAIRLELNARLEAARTALRLPSLNQLNQPRPAVTAAGRWSA